jgi:hypothetical protein
VATSASRASSKVQENGYRQPYKPSGRPRKNSTGVDLSDLPAAKRGAEKPRTTTTPISRWVTSCRCD